MVTYNFTKVVSSDRLTQEIQTSAITVALDHITTSGTTVYVNFKAQLTELEMSILDGIIQSHQAIPLAENVIPTVKVSEAPEPYPFAQPVYRTKRDATTSLVSVEPGSSEIIDYQLAEERYCSGGRLIVIGASVGDYFTAEIYDRDGVIPAIYRSAVSENYPTIAKYVSKEWVSPDGDHEMSSYPLNARITPGLCLRVTYTAVNSGTTRKVGVNYYLFKKL